MATWKCYISIQTPLESEIWLQNYEQFIKSENNIKQKNLFICQYLKNNICDIRLIPLDHVTYKPIATIAYRHTR